MQQLPSALHYTLAAHLSNVNACGSGKGGLVPIKWDVLNAQLNEYSATVHAQNNFNYRKM